MGKCVKLTRIHGTAVSTATVRKPSALSGFLFAGGLGVPTVWPRIFVLLSLECHRLLPLLYSSLVPCSDPQSSAAVVREKAEVEAAKGAVEGQAGRLTLETERLRRRAQEQENEVAKLNRIIDEAKLQESRQGDRAGRLEVRVRHAKAIYSSVATDCASKSSLPA